MPDKKAKVKARYPTGKNAQLSPSPAGPEPHISWRFNEVDRNGDWAWTLITADDLLMVMGVLAQMDSRTWGAASGDGIGEIKAIPLEHLSPGAHARLRTVRRDDLDFLHEIRFGNKPRLWGIRRGYIFHVLWWDPDHLVCPSELRHT